MEPKKQGADSSVAPEPPATVSVNGPTQEVAASPARSGDLRSDELAPQFAAGERVGGRYRIVRLLAAGGMGEVYEAEDLELRVRVALKTILAGASASDRA